ncbi:putative GTP diphosphokinase RSH1 [Chlorella vulgaris]
MQGLGSRLRGLGTSALPPPALSLRYRVIRLPGPVATLSQAPLTTATSRGLLAAVNGLAKWQWPAVLATATQVLMGHPAVAGLPPTLGQHPGQAAWMTLASLFTLAASMSGVLYYMARTTWEGIEPYVFQQSLRRQQDPLLLHGVDVSGSRFFSRPVVLQAAEFAAAAHRGQVRKTRTPYVAHCVETALIVEGLLSPTEEDDRAEAAVVAALLHDVLDDTDAEVGEVQELFGEQVASMVSKVSQLSTTNQIVRRRLRVESAQPTKEEEAQLRNMILTMVGEPLVIAIKLADRLHNMRTVYALSPEKQQAVASETRRVWCSLAERLGMFALKSELEDLCFAVLQPAEYRALRRQLDELVAPSMPACLTTLSALAASALAERQSSHAAASSSSSKGVGGSSGGSSGAGGSAPSKRRASKEFAWLTPPQLETKQLIDTVLPFDATTFNIAKLRSGEGARRGLEVLQACAQLLMREIGTESLASGLEVAVQGRLKSLYSTFRKMGRKGVPLSEVYDARALRVVVDDEGGRRQAEAIAACYKLLPAVHRLFRRVAGEEDDYIASPKPSGYQSLHTAVVGPGGVPMEVQMRTSSMHSQAEYGKAAHWAYKEKPPSAASTTIPVPDLTAASSGSSSSGSSADDATAQQLDKVAGEQEEGGGVAVGHPLLHIGPGGRLRDAVVVLSEYGGRRLLAAVSQQQRAVPDARPAAAGEYRRLLTLVEERGYFQPSQGDMAVALELFTLCSDGKYHLLDRFGHKMATVVVPLTVEDQAEEQEQQFEQGGAAQLPPALAHAAGVSSGGEASGHMLREGSEAAGLAPEHVPSSTAAEGEMDYMNNRIRLLRSMLEWGRELGASIAAESALAEEAANGNDAAAIAAWTEKQLAPRPRDGAGASADVMVLVWPGGRILRVPRGTTAGSVIRDLGLIEISPSSPPPSSSSDPGSNVTLPVGASPRDRAAAAAAVGQAAAKHAQRARRQREQQQQLVNVNNRLVPEETPLFDGDYVVLSRDKVVGGGGRQRQPGFGRLAFTTTCQALQAPDYSFYQRLREGELTEDYLWETRLLPQLRYLSAAETVAVREALSLAYDAHSGQRRKSGEAFITHPVEVTRILAELRMDYESLVAGLLHDTVEDCGDLVGLDEINFHFGPAVRRIVEGETKFSKLPTHHPEDRNTTAARSGGTAADIVSASNGAAGAVDPKAQDLQFLFLAMTEEVRIIVVKLADRLHNMRTMASMPPSKQRRIAQETLQVFAPLARLLGLYSIKEELEELSFKYALPAQYDEMRRSMNRLWEAQQPVVEAARAELQERLDNDPYLLVRVEGVRVDACRKALYSTWRKLHQAGRSVKEVGDIAQLRVVITPRVRSAADGAMAMDGGSERQLCYHVMGLVHASWAPIPGSMKDYIATPKPNNYQCLHTTVVPTGLDLAAALLQNGDLTPALRKKSSVQLLFPIEVQIRSEEMNRLAENGIAVESWSCADRTWQREEPAGGQEAGTGSWLSVSGEGSSGSGSSGSSDEWEEAGSGSEGTASSNGSSSNGASSSANGSRRASGGKGSVAAADSAQRFPFNLGRLVANMAGGVAKPPNTSEPSSSNGTSSNGASSNGASNGASSSSNGSSNGRSSGRSSGSGVLSSSGGRGVLGEGSIDPKVLSRRINWLKSIREWQSEFVGTLTASEFVECVTDDLLGQSVFVFTPSGDVVRLPKGATVIDFAYHIHTEMGNTMVAAKVNGKVVSADRELQNAEVVEVVRYKGPINATIIRRHQQWLDAAQTRTARHKIAKFLRQHAALAVSKAMPPPSDSAEDAQQQQAAAAAAAAAANLDARQVTWLVIQCDDRPGLLAEVANVIARHQHNISAYSGFADSETGLFVMEYQLEGRPSALHALCEELSCIESVASWATGCALPEAQQQLRRVNM